MPNPFFHDTIRSDKKSLFLDGGEEEENKRKKKGGGRQGDENSRIVCRTGKPALSTFRHLRLNIHTDTTLYP
ncbi:hypothetical protein BgiBS90_006865 [Biomphalaria glabrata]|nr:hypothetical protein BgiMline_008552 [Biomphalaria glabrata]KAI8791401.1 hypothetical protein BgiBS90_006865 [Biomphalaria glabrata]